jgi:hypothetical protein
MPPSAPAARRVSAAVALAKPPPSSKKSMRGISFERTCFRLYKIFSNSDLRGYTFDATAAERFPAKSSHYDPVAIKHRIGSK